MKTGKQILSEYNLQPSSFETFKTLEEMIDDCLLSGAMKTQQGNLLDIQPGVICHQVNCRRVAGAGLALQVRERWPGWYVAFRQYNGRLGDVHYFRANQDLVIASLYAQDGYGHGDRYTDYEALYKCLDLVSGFKSVMWCYGDAQVYIPHGLGCGLAGGAWGIVSAMIKEVLPGAIVVRRGI